MTMQLDPTVLAVLVHERQEQLRRRPVPAVARRTPSLRVRIGRALIAAGSAISGERVDVAAGRARLPKAV